MKKLFIILSIWCSLPVFAQINYQPGWVILKESQDTLPGYIDYREWEINPEQIWFKAKSSSEQRTAYNLDNCSAFGIVGKEFFKRAIVTKYLQPIESTEIDIDTKEESVIDTVFLRCLVKGEKASLYEITESRRKQYFMETPENGIQTLRYYKTKNAQTGIITSYDVYKNQIRPLVTGDKKLSNQLQLLPYKDMRLYALFKRLNHQPVANTSFNKSSFKFWLGAGASMGRLKFSGNVPYWESTHKFETNYSPLVSTGLDLVPSRLQRRIFLRLSAAYYATYYKSMRNSEVNNGGQFERSFELKQRNYLINLSFNGAPIPLSVHSFIYIGAGVRYNFSSYSKNVITLLKLTTNEIRTFAGPHTHEKWGHFFIQTGLKINEHIDVNGSYNLSGSFYNSRSFGVTIPPYQVLFIYRL